MKFSSLFVASPTAAALSISLLLCGPSGMAMSQTGDATTTLPDVTVDAPSHVARRHKPIQHSIVRSSVLHRTSPSASTLTPMEKLARLPNMITGSCVDGCVSSLPSGNKPWVGCNWSSISYSTTCRNVGHYKTYSECKTAGLALGLRDLETIGYCTSLAFKS